MTTGTADPKLDGRIDWGGTAAALASQFPPSTTRIGIFANTSDQGMVYNNGSSWVGTASAVTSPTYTNLAITGLFTESSTDTITAHAGGGQASAVALTTELNRVTVVATAGDSVKLPASAAGLTIVVTNHGANPMQVYGAGTDTIDDVATATGISQMSNSVVIYACTTAGAWYTEGLATGYIPGTSLQTFSAVDGITARAGGGQGSAVPLIAMMNRISVCATGGDSVLLPASAKGMDVTVTNAGAASLNVFPNGTDNINGLGASTAFALGAGKSVQFVSYTAGVLHTLPLVP